VCKCKHWNDKDKQEKLFLEEGKLDQIHHNTEPREKETGEF